VRLDGEVRHLAQDWRKRALGPSKVWTKVIGQVSKDDPPPKFLKFTVSAAKDIRKRWAADKKAAASSGSERSGKGGPGGKSKQAAVSSAMKRVGYEDMMAEAGFASGKLDATERVRRAAAASAARSVGAQLPRFKLPNDGSESQDKQSHHHQRTTTVSRTVMETSSTPSTAVANSTRNPLQDLLKRFGGQKAKPPTAASPEAAQVDNRVRGRVRNLSVGTRRAQPSLDITIERVRGSASRDCVLQQIDEL